MWISFWIFSIREPMPQWKEIYTAKCNIYREKKPTRLDMLSCKENINCKEKKTIRKFIVKPKTTKILK
jgi:hypothetical protein